MSGDLIPEEAIAAAAKALETGEVDADDPRAWFRGHAANAVQAAAPLILTAEADRMLASLHRLWPDPFGEFSAEQAHAARIMKQAVRDMIDRRASVLRGEGDRNG